MTKARAAKPFVLGLTGSIASGKTTVLEIFKNSGLFTLSADALGHEALACAGVQKKLQKEFACHSREELARLVFKRPSARTRLEAILHPLILKKAQKLLAGCGARVAVFEVPLLFEAGWDKYVDMTLLVAGCGRGLENRLKQRGLTLAQYKARLKTQLPQEEKFLRSDLVIINNSTKQHLEQKVRRLARALNDIYG